MVWGLGKKILLVLFVFVNLPFCSQATVSRGEVVSYSLDYYEIQKEKSLEHQVVQQKEQEDLDAKKQAALERWKLRKEKINSYLKNTLITLEGRVSYNDNIFSTQTNQQSDIINMLTIKADYIPKVDWTRKRKTDFFFDVQGDGLSYSTGKSKDNTRTGLRAGLNYHMTDKYGALLDYQFIKSQATASAEGSSKFVQNIANTFGGKLSADWGRFPCSLRYTHETSNYEQGFETSNTIKDLLVTTANVRISPKTQAFVQYDLGEVAFPKSETDNYNFGIYSLGLRGKLSAKITGVVRTGWGEYDYDSGAKRQTENASGDVNYQLSERFLFSTGAGRSIEATTYSTNDASEQRNLHFSFKYFPPFNKKLVLNAGMQFTNIKLEESERDDDTTQMRLGAEYGLNKRTKLALNYARTVRDSNVEGKNFTQNFISLKGDFDF